jgi:hypothetical protein
MDTIGRGSTAGANGGNPDAPEAGQLVRVRGQQRAVTGLADPLDGHLRAQERKARLQRELDAGQARETRGVEAVFAQLKAGLDAALAGPGAVQLTLDQLDERERRPFERDREAWRARRDGIEEEKQRELGAIKRRYENVRELVFPFAIALCVPGDEGVPGGGKGGPVSRAPGVPARRSAGATPGWSCCRSPGRSSPCRRCTGCSRTACRRCPPGTGRGSAGSSPR